MKSLKLSQPKSFSKGEILLKPGDIAKHAYFVHSGCLKSYIIDESGKEHILQFAPESWVISDIDSSTNRVPSVVFIEAIENSKVSPMPTIDFKDLNALEKDLLASMAFKFRNNLIASNKRIIGLLSATSVQRYIDFTETYPSLVQRLPLKLIASYIGVTPEYLSDIRRKIAKK